MRLPQFTTARLMAAIGVLVLAGCASRLSPKDLTPQVRPAWRQHPESVAVTARAATPEGEQFLAGQDQTLQDAIMNGLDRSGLFGKSAGGGPADCQLEVSLLSVPRPASGMTMMTSATMTWKLTRVRDGQVLFQTTIVTEFTESVADTLSADTRLRDVLRGAVRKNIGEGIEELGRADFQAGSKKD